MNKISLNNTPSIETQENFIREVYKRNRPDEIRQMEAAIDHPELDPQVRELILKIRKELLAVGKNPETDNGNDHDPEAWENGGRRVQPRPTLALIDGDTDSPGFSPDSK